MPVAQPLVAAGNLHAPLLVGASVQSLPPCSHGILLVSQIYLLQGHMSLDLGPTLNAAWSHLQMRFSFSKTLFPNKITFISTRNQDLDISFGDHDSTYYTLIFLPSCVDWHVDPVCLSLHLGALRPSRKLGQVISVEPRLIPACFLLPLIPSSALRFAVFLKESMNTSQIESIPGVAGTWKRGHLLSCRHSLDGQFLSGFTHLLHPLSLGAATGGLSSL